MKKKFPRFKSDREAEEFVAKADLAEYDFSDMAPMRFELKPKDKSINLRLPEQLLDAIRKKAKRIGMPYQRFIRLKLEQALHQKP
jgi:predicted DNA binding CopG/RHH family protein